MDAQKTPVTTHPSTAAAMGSENASARPDVSTGMEENNATVTFASHKEKRARDDLQEDDGAETDSTKKMKEGIPEDVGGVIGCAASDASHVLFAKNAKASDDEIADDEIAMQVGAGDHVRDSTRNCKPTRPTARADSPALLPTGQPPSL